MASSRELCYCMLLGIGFCYLLTFFLLSKPNVISCALFRVFIGASMSAIYAAILVKTNRVARIFKPSSAIRPKFISPSSQVQFLYFYNFFFYYFKVAICFAIVSMQLIGSIILLFIDPPGITIQYPTRIGKVILFF